MDLPTAMTRKRKRRAAAVIKRNTMTKTGRERSIEMISIGAKMVINTGTSIEIRRGRRTSIETRIKKETSQNIAQVPPVK